MVQVKVEQYGELFIVGEASPSGSNPQPKQVS